LAIQTTFSQKIAGPEDPDYSFASPPGHNCDLHSPAEEIIDPVGAVSLRIDHPAFLILDGLRGRCRLSKIRF